MVGLGPGQGTAGLGCSPGERAGTPPARLALVAGLGRLDVGDLAVILPPRVGVVAVGVRGERRGLDRPGSRSIMRADRLDRVYVVIYRIQNVISCDITAY